ncbi:hypothetical protein [Tsukamurella paurometabola]
MINPVAPKVPAVKLAALDDGDVADLVPGETYDRVRFADAVVEDRDLGGITFSECELADWELRDTALADAALLETRIARIFATGFSARGHRCGRWSSTVRESARWSCSTPRSGRSPCATADSDS